MTLKITDRATIVGAVAAAAVVFTTAGAAVANAAAPARVVEAPTSQWSLHHGPTRQQLEAAQAAKERALRAKQSPKYAKAFARTFMKEHYGWGASQFAALDNLWTRESEWVFDEENPSSGAYGIPQSLPANKMASAGKDWRTNPETQIRWGLKYIKQTYGSPSAAWAHSQSNNWY